MKLRARITAPSLGLVCALATILIVLAILQVRWSNQVSQAQRERMQAELYIAVTRFRRNFRLEMLRVCRAFQTVPAGPPRRILQAYADHYDDWMGASAQPGLVAGLYAWMNNGSAPKFFRFDPARERFTGAAWPPQFQTLRARVRRETASGRFTQPPAGQEEEPWVIDEQIPALYHAWWSVAPRGEGASRAEKTVTGGVILPLDMDFVRRILLPMLSDRYFRGPEGFTYRVTIVSGEHPVRIIYQSAPGSTSAALPTGDVVEDLLFSNRMASAQPASGAGRTAPHVETEEEAGSAIASLESADSRAFQGQSQPYALIVPASGRASWKLIVRHRAGSVEAAVMHLRRRNLAVSFGVLALLAASMALVLVSARRAHRLAKLQIDFVAGVSHELRTPLAVICSAAENLADGVISTKEQVMNYGALMRSEGRRLSEMVEQVLIFATGQAGRPSYRLGLASVAELLDAALNRVQPMIESSAMIVERKLAPDLPLVMADASALERCLQNLISNAVKYGEAGGWIGIHARKTESTEETAVEITIEDRGSGIDAEDLPHIFEPFYRGKAESMTQARGAGLGLSLAKDIAEAMGGRLSVESSLGRGSRFTLHLPALSAGEAASSPDRVKVADG